MKYKSVLGLDRHPSGMGFSVVLVRGEAVALRREIVSPEEAARIAVSQEVEAVAIDNIYELGDEGEIRRFVGSLLRSELVQVTGSPEKGFLPLSVIGRQIGMTRGEKLDPMRSAEVCARAAASGIGYAVRVYGPETKITISRRRRGGSGGMSSERYRRSVEGAVQSLVSRITSALEAGGFEYDLEIKKGSHGTRGASFTVYAPRSRLFGLVRQIRTSSVNVKITPLYTKSFEYMSLAQEGRRESSKRYLIVGIDPGMVTGVAVLDLSGRILSLSSGRGVTRGQIARRLSELGRALVFATDVCPPPDMVNKLAAMHNALVYAPDRPMKTQEKAEISNRIASEQGVEVADAHQRDSLAAAFKAYSSFRNKLDQCYSHARMEGETVDVEEVKALVIRGLSISDAIAKSRCEPPPQPPPLRVRASGERERIRVLESKFEDLRAERDVLLEKIDKLSSRVEELEDELRLTRLEYRQPKSPDTYEMERRIRSLLDEISRLRAELESVKDERHRLRWLLEMVAGGSHVVLRRHRRINEASNSLREVKGHWAAYLESVGQLDDDTAKTLRALGRIALILDEKPDAGVRDKLWGMGVPFVLASSLKGMSVGEFLAVEMGSLELAVENARYEMLANEKTPDRMRALFEEYRRERQETLRRGLPSAGG
ncbi:MAG: DUF460 domain-containing protein [Candidatus Verstraetearchaeota archaeon]|nr:DUF460 domain-containing protein [Candidatus Verstraetearchaeota archaeon]